MASIVAIIAALAAVLCSALLFTNAVEWFGRRAGLSQGTLGSVFAAVGTALPETAIAVLATVSAGASSVQGRAGDAVGLGAILGAPLLLATLGLAMLGGGALRRGAATLDIPVTVQRDLAFFLVTFGGAVALGVFGPSRAMFWRWPVALGLFAAYLAFLLTALGVNPWTTVGIGGGDGEAAPGHRVRWPEPGFRVVGAAVAPARSALPAGGGRRLRVAGHEGPGGDPAPLFLTRALDREAPGWAPIALQIGAALGLMLAGAEVFVRTLTGLSLRLGLSGYVLAVLVAPLATELPETANSLVWARAGKDALAASNVTGALVLQGSVVPALGILFTPWHFTRPEAVGALCALIAVGAAYLSLQATGRLSAWLVLAGSALYLAYVLYLL